VAHLSASHSRQKTASNPIALEIAALDPILAVTPEFEKLRSCHAFGESHFAFMGTALRLCQTPSVIGEPKTQ